jgi:N-methylhydantoinase A/oxoprolinase/acetone carboxylase beta subunit
VVVAGDAGLVGAAKVLTTPGDPLVGFVSGVRDALADGDIPSARVEHVVHATTLVTNAIIERRGARVGLVTTAGFRDVLEIAFETRYDLYDLHLRLPEPLVPRELRAEVPERIGADGSVVTPLDLDEALREVTRLVEEEQVEALAVCFLHSHVNPAHELALAAAVERCFPHLPLSVSSQVAPFIREYPRFSTTAANAYVQPLAGSYLRGLRGRLADAGLSADPYLMLSHGGLTDLDSGMRVPIRLCESGPAAGVTIGASLAASLGIERAVSFDMGGTTAKICMIADGVPHIGRDLEVAHESRFMAGSGLPLAIQSVQLLEIGAGGGSIVGTDATGLLEVGPRSAGADPGPACYGAGGSEPTITDANLLLGHLPPQVKLGGRLALDADAAERAFAPLATRFGLSAVEVAHAAYDLVNEKMALAVRRHLVEFGHEPNGFALIVTGGAAPAHACALAEKLGIRRIVVPSGAGVGSAIGLLAAPYVVERSRSVVTSLEAGSSAFVRATFAELEREAAGAGDASFGDDYRLRYFLDLRYRGQGYELTVEVPADLVAAEDLTSRVERLFADAYRARFGRDLPGWPVELLALTVRSESAPLPLHTSAQAAMDGAHDEGRIWYGGRWRRTPVAPWLSFPVGEAVPGPLVLTDPSTTVLVPPRWTVERRPDWLELAFAGGES